MTNFGTCGGGSPKLEQRLRSMLVPETKHPRASHTGRNLYHKTRPSKQILLYRRTITAKSSSSHDQRRPGIQQQWPTASDQILHTAGNEKQT